MPGYETLGELGKGAMGVVYRARQQTLNRLVALKLVRCEGTGAEVPRFLTGAGAVAAIRHVNVVQIYECGDCAGQPFMALEYLPGGTLAARLAETGRFPTGEVLRAHEAAKFASPEADVWALGVILYECLAGRRPFVAVCFEALVAQILAVDVVPVRKHAPAVPRELERICLKCLAKRPGARYPTAKGRAADLDQFLAGAPRVRFRFRPVRGPRMVLALVVPVLIAAGVGGAVLSDVFDRPAGVVVPPKPVVLVPHSQVGLFDGRSVLPWTGRNVVLELDDEKKPVLTGWGGSPGDWTRPPTSG
ncbi:MAG TPA: serine/threonine-protein kinase [Gemmata sp.]